MNESSKLSQSAREAADWLSRRLDVDSWSEADETEFQSWLSQSPGNEREFRIAERLLTQVELNPGLELQAEIDRTLQTEPTLPDHPFWKRRTWMAVGSVGTAAAIAASVIWWLAQPQVVATGLAERKTFDLDDGSKLQLDSLTRVEIEFRDDRRVAVLRSGRAVFDIASDPARPFEVTAGQGVIEVLGTVFEVNLVTPDRRTLREPTADLLEVSVQEGLVALESETRNLSTETERVKLTPGQAASWRTDKSTPELSDFPIETFGEWRSGRLVYRNRPFKYVIADLKREYGGEIVLRDPALSELPVSGTLTTSDLQRTFQLLADVLRVKIEQTPDGTLVIDRILQR